MDRPINSSPEHGIEKQNMRSTESWPRSIGSASPSVGMCPFRSEVRALNDAQDSWRRTGRMLNGAQCTTF